MNDSAIFGMLGLLIGGAGVWAVMHLRLQGARQFFQERRANDQADIRYYRDASKDRLALLDESERAHSRLSDAHNTQSARIERALDQVTEGANATVVRMARILKGDA